MKNIIENINQLEKEMDLEGSYKELEALVEKTLSNAKTAREKLNEKNLDEKNKKVLEEVVGQHKEVIDILFGNQFRIFDAVEALEQNKMNVTVLFKNLYADKLTSNPSLSEFQEKTKALYERAIKELEG